VSQIKVSTVIDAPPAHVWRAIEDISSHVEWMADAEEIRFTSPTTSGVGTTFDCATRVGPLRLTDHMRITEWQPDAVMGVRHVGAVTGEGRFTLQSVGVARTQFTWEEQLRFPWWFAGPVGALVASPLLRAIWRRNLAALKARIEGAPNH
jgi:carbon monoxide dehydrogenase subunit G